MCPWAYLMNVSPTFVYLVYLVCAIYFLCDNINTKLPLSNILDITKQFLILLLHLLCVIYIQFCSFHFLHTALHYSTDVH